MRTFLSLLLLLSSTVYSSVKLGIDQFLEHETAVELKGKRVALVLNQTSYTSNLEPTYEWLQRHAAGMKIVAIFTPEHGLHGAAYAAEAVEHTKNADDVPIYSLHGSTRRPTEQMLQGLDAIIFDIQDIGARSYTFASTLFYIMEEAAQKGIRVVVLDRPNPINGTYVEGPMLHEEWRSFLGYVNVPYCHGMTIGELAFFFNEEYHINAHLKIVPMQGWKRWMAFKQTGLPWIPTSPNIPESDTPFFYASTGIIGEISLVNIGIGYTQPFKLIGAPWIQAEPFAKKLNDQKLPGVKFIPYHFRPFYGAYKGENCEGVKILITDLGAYRPMLVQYFILGILKSFYPDKVNQLLDELPDSKKKLFSKVVGNSAFIELLKKEKYVAWKLVKFDEDGRKAFLQKRKKYLLY